MNAEICYVEDDSVIAESVKEYLTKYNLHVEAVPSVSKAREIL